MSSVIGNRMECTAPTAFGGTALALVRARTLALPSTLVTDGSTLLLSCP